MRPDKMLAAVEGASSLLRGRTEVRTGDWLDTVADAAAGDFVYMDPPYFGTSEGRDRRYAEWMTQERLIGGLTAMSGRGLRFALSYDGACGGKEYGPAPAGQPGIDAAPPACWAVKPSHTEWRQG